MLTRYRLQRHGRRAPAPRLSIMLIKTVQPPEGPKWQPNWRKNVTPEEFIEARKATKRPGFLSPLHPDDIREHKLILSEDGKVGAALSPDGDIQNVFNNGGPRGAGNEAMIEAISCGGDTLDCFDGHLPTYYHQFGFNEVGRMKFNREYAPPDWDYEKYGEPDVVFMARNEGDDFDAIKQRAYGDRTAWNQPKQSDILFEGHQWDEAKENSRRTARSRKDRAGKGLGVGQSARRIDLGSGSGGGDAGGLAKSLGRDRYRLMFRKAPRPTRPKKLGAQIFSVSAKEAFPEEEYKKLRKDTLYSVIYDPRSNKWHIPNQGHDVKFFHEKYIDQLLPDETGDRDVHLIRGWLHPGKDDITTYSIADAYDDYSVEGVAPNVLQTMDRGFKKAAENALMVGNRVLKVRRLGGERQ